MSHHAGIWTPGASERMLKAKFGRESYWRRLMLVMSSMSPLFLLWAIRGTCLIDNWSFVGICLALFTVSNVYILFIVLYGKRSGTHRRITVETADDRRHDIISYLFAMMLPFYTVDLDTWRNLAASVAAFLIVVVLFTSLNLHYMNLWVALFGYHSFQVTTPKIEGQNQAIPAYMVITKRSVLRHRTEVTGTLVGVTVLLEGSE